ncbi:hypothetical protein HispidOSU_007083 [Sigmodon hispidus]
MADKMENLPPEHHVAGLPFLPPTSSSVSQDLLIMFPGGHDLQAIVSPELSSNNLRPVWSCPNVAHDEEHTIFNCPRVLRVGNHWRIKEKDFQREEEQQFKVKNSPHNWGSAKCHDCARSSRNFEWENTCGKWDVCLAYAAEDWLGQDGANASGQQILLHHDMAESIIWAEAPP